jgi:hypothetical protein
MFLTVLSHCRATELCFFLLERTILYIFIPDAQKIRLLCPPVNIVFGFR